MAEETTIITNLLMTREMAEKAYEKPDAGYFIALEKDMNGIVDKLNETIGLANVCAEVTNHHTKQIKDLWSCMKLFSIFGLVGSLTYLGCCVWDLVDECKRYKKEEQNAAFGRYKWKGGDDDE